MSLGMVDPTTRNPVQCRLPDARSAIYTGIRKLEWRSRVIAEAHLVWMPHERPGVMDKWGIMRSSRHSVIRSPLLHVNQAVERVPSPE